MVRVVLLNASGDVWLTKGGWIQKEVTIQDSTTGIPYAKSTPCVYRAVGAAAVDGILLSSHQRTTHMPF